MKIERLEILRLRMPLVRHFETSFGRVHDQETLIVRVESGGVVGWGEAPCSAAPRFSYETVKTAWHIIRDFLAPRLRDVEIVKPVPVSELFANVRGHNMAKAAVEMAVLDLVAKQAGVPLWRQHGGTQEEIPTGISLGIQDSIDELLRLVEESLGKGYRRIKVKIKPRWDVDVLAAIRARWPDIPLMADANAAYTLADAGHLKRLDEFNLMMIEQPLDHEDLVDHSRLQPQLKTPICLDESIRGYHDARRALEIGACRVINIKPARVGGPFAARAIQSLCRKQNVPVWCGGMLETGIGRAHNLAVATLPGFTLPGDISASERYWTEDIVDPPVIVSPQGTLRAPEAPGIGYSVVEARVLKRAVRRETVLG